MKSFIPWVGGKSLLAKKITSLFPDDIDRYIEVFGGGGSVLFYKENHANLEIYNDFNSCLVNLFRCAKYHREELQREISGYFNSREIFEEIKEKLKISGFTDIQRAAMFYVQIKISYGSDTRTFGCNRKNLSPDYLEKVVIVVVTCVKSASYFDCVTLFHCDFFQCLFNFFIHFIFLLKFGFSLGFPLRCTHYNSVQVKKQVAECTENQ